MISQSEKPTAFTLSDALAGLALMAGASTVISLVTNILIFNRWGIDYGTVATASDIFIGGISVLRFSLFGAALFGLIYFVIHNAKFFSFKYKSWMDWIFLCAGLVNLACLVVFSSNNTGFISSMPLQKWVVYLSISATIISFFKYFGTVGRLKDDIVRGFAITGFLCSLIIVTIYTAERGQGDLVTQVPDSNCIREHVVWLTSENVITTCSSPPFRDDMIFKILPRENLFFITHREEHLR